MSKDDAFYQQAAQVHLARRQAQTQRLDGQAVARLSAVVQTYIGGERVGDVPKEGQRYVDYLQRLVVAGQRLPFDSSSYFQAIEAIGHHQAGHYQLAQSTAALELAVQALALIFNRLLYGKTGEVRTKSVWAEKDTARLPLWFMKRAFDQNPYHNTSGAVDPVVRLCENPEFASLDTQHLFPGRVTLEIHDMVHLLVSRGQKMADEAWTIGVTMGATGQMDDQKIAAYLYVAQNFYKPSYRFKAADGLVFWYAVKAAQKALDKGLHNLGVVPYHYYWYCSLADIRADLGLTPELNFSTQQATDLLAKVSDLKGLVLELEDDALAVPIAAAVQHLRPKALFDLLAPARFKVADTHGQRVDLIALNQATSDCLALVGESTQDRISLSLEENDPPLPTRPLNFKKVKTME